jgi:hypothetical protein
MTFFRNHRAKIIAVTSSSIAASAIVLVVAVPAFTGTSSNKDAAPTPPAIPVPATAVVDHGATLVDGAQWRLSTFTAADGRLCVQEHVLAGVGEGCFDPSKLFNEGPIALSYGSTVAPGNPQSLAHVWLWGFVSPSVARLQIVTAACARKAVAVDDDHVFFTVLGAGGRFDAASWPIRVEALASDGSVIGTKDIDLGSALGQSKVVSPARAAC